MVRDHTSSDFFRLTVRKYLVHHDSPFDRWTVLNNWSCLQHPGKIVVTVRSTNTNRSIYLFEERVKFLARDAHVDVRLVHRALQYCEVKPETFQGLSRLVLGRSKIVLPSVVTATASTAVLREHPSHFVLTALVRCRFFLMRARNSITASGFRVVSFSALSCSCGLR